MNKLFSIETDDVELIWRAPAQSRKRLDGIGDVPGHLLVRGLRPGLVFNSIWRASVPEQLSYSQDITAGPQFYEQTDYRVYARSKQNKRIDLVHIDPNIRKGLIAENDSKIVYGSVNFKSEVGYSKFAVAVDGKPEFEFEIEVFPSKLDYKTDYEQLVAETQDYISGLVFEYLRSTYKLSVPLLDKQSSTVEWLLLLQLVVVDLEQACEFIAHRPLRGLRRERQAVKAEKLKRLDSIARTSIHRGTGSGSIISVSDELHMRQQIDSLNTAQILDTPEHRWIVMQMKRIRERLLSLHSVERSREPTERRQKIVGELEMLERRIFRLQQFGPFRDSHELPPAGFASLQLVSAPGYRECYRACNILTLGLQIEGGPVNLSLKELSLLYEYWCFLTLVNLLSKAVGQPIPVDQLVTATTNGLEIQLKKGRESIVRFKLPEGRQIEIIYNKSIINDAVLVPQQPDILISLKESGWPTLNLLLDAKYRVRFDDDYIKRYRMPGPDIDAVNALHRYRDAILEFDQDGVSRRPKRTIVQAAALFPFRETTAESYRVSLLWESLERLGVGAIPLIPGCKSYLEEWLQSVLRHGGWSVADRAVRHRATDRADDWRIAASDSVLVGVLNSEFAAEHLRWILSEKCYYMPMRKEHPRQLSVKHVAIYSPSSIRTLGAVTHRAEVQAIEVRNRSEIITPWLSSTNGDEPQVIYHLDEVKSLRRPIVNQNDGKGARFSSPRWASRLSLERANDITELLLESEPEWRLYEELSASGIKFKLLAGSPSALKIDGTNWRAWFVIGCGARVRYAGLHGFQLEDPSGAGVQLVSPLDVVLFISSNF